MAHEAHDERGYVRVATTTTTVVTTTHTVEGVGDQAAEVRAREASHAAPATPANPLLIATDPSLPHGRWPQLY